MSSDGNDFSALFGQVDSGAPPPSAGPSPNAGVGTSAGTSASTSTGTSAGTSASARTADGSPSPGAPTSLKSEVAYEDFVVYGPSRMCIYLPCRTPWPNASVDEWLPWRPKLDAQGNPVKKKGKVVMQSPVASLLETRRCAAMSWSPGDPEFIHGRLPVDAGWVTKAGAITFNSYRPPIFRPGNPAGAKRWVEHWHATYPAAEADHAIAYLAHLTQRPGVKINHCLVLYGKPKIGKDTLLVPMAAAVGAGNHKDISLRDLISKNNEFLRAVFVLLSEARDHGEQGRVDRYALYDHMKQILATPPNMLRINEKYIREYYIVNCFGMAATTNHADAFYLTPDDRRYFVAWSESQTEDFNNAYWSGFWHYYREENGIDDVVAFLRGYDISGFDPKAPPPKTPGFWHMVNAERGDEHGALLGAIEKLNQQRAAASKPIDVVTISDLVAVAPGLDGLRDMRMRRKVGKQLGACGYIAVDNTNSTQGLWFVGGQQQRIYACEKMPRRDREELARKRAAE
jgi:hypothetical protein